MRRYWKSGIYETVSSSDAQVALTGKKSPLLDAFVIKFELESVTTFVPSLQLNTMTLRGPEGSG
jgi:hypothetical protein